MSSSDWLFQQAAALAYRLEAGEPRVVLVTSRTSGRWLFPKGLIDPGYTAEETAVKEAYEEAGIVGQVVGESFGSYQHPKPRWHGVAEVEVFPVLVTELLDEWEEQGSRERAVMTIDEAKTRVRAETVPFLDALARMLEQQN